MKPETRQRSTIARDAILARIRSANKKRASGEASASAEHQSATMAEHLPDAVRKHMQARNTHTLPSWPAMNDDTARLLEQMERVQITITRVQTQREVVQVVDEYRREQGIEGPLIVSPQLLQADGIEWPDGTLSGAARDALHNAGGTRGDSFTGDSVPEITSVTPCFCAVAETGSIVTTSDAGRPSTLNFLPDNHVVVLHENQIVRHVDDVWQRVRETSTESSDTTTGVPRAVNFITGPSRTADIEQTLELGAHGPKRMHVVLVAAELPAGPAEPPGSAA